MVHLPGHEGLRIILHLFENFLETGHIGKPHLLLEDGVDEDALPIALGGRLFLLQESGGGAGDEQDRHAGRDEPEMSLSLQGIGSAVERQV